MGRYSTYEAERRGRRVGVRMTTTEAAALRSAAARRGCTVTELIVQLLEQAGELQSASVRAARGIS